MPVYRVSKDNTDSTSSSLRSDVQDLVSKLTEVDGRIKALLADGYETPEAERTFGPFFEEYKKNYNGVKDGLEGIAAYLKGVGDGFDETDKQLAKSLAG